MTARTFVLGLGAQKAGTSWLHGYLARQPFADFGLLKEYHVWDALRIPECSGFRATWRDFVSLRRGWAPVPDRGAMLRRRLQRGDGAWERHFAALALGYERRHPGAERFLTGDITPAYSGLGPADLAEIRRRIEGEGFAVKVVFLCAIRWNAAGARCA